MFVLGLTHGLTYGLDPKLVSLAHNIGKASGIRNYCFLVVKNAEKKQENFIAHVFITARNCCGWGCKLNTIIAR